MSSNLFITHTPPLTADAFRGLILRVSYNANGDLEYFAWANPKTAESEAGWWITQYVYDGNNKLISSGFKDGVFVFDGVWTARASYSYS